MPDPKPESPDLSDYLGHSAILDYDHPMVEETAEQLTYGIKDTLSKVRSLFEFVRDQIFYSFHINATSVTLTASEVLEKGHGSSFSKAHLFAALARSQDIPAGFCYRLTLSETGVPRPVLHGYNAVFIQEMERWIFLDACVSPEITGDSHGFYSETLITDPVKTSSRWFHKPGAGLIYVSPNKKVISTLEHARDVEELKEVLPGKL